VSDVARETGIPNSSATNILAALVETGFVRRAGSGFTLGPLAVELASAFLRTDDPVQRFRDFVPTLEALSAETSQLATLDRGDVLFLSRHDGVQPIALTSSVGKRLPASSTAIGKAMLATLDPGDVEVLLEDPLPHLTERSHTSTSSLLADLATTRHRGFAVDDEEAAPNVMCLAVAVDCDPGEPRYAVSTTLFKDRVTPGLKHSLVGDLTALASYLAK
jgi:DNA-binding IclR family transcriptional regulator